VPAGARTLPQKPGPCSLVEEAAHRLSIGRTTMYALLKARAIESIRVGRLRRVPADAPTGTAVPTALSTGHSAALRPSPALGFHGSSTPQHTDRSRT